MHNRVDVYAAAGHQNYYVLEIYPGKLSSADGESTWKSFMGACQGFGEQPPVAK